MRCPTVKGRLCLPHCRCATIGVFKGLNYVSGRTRRRFVTLAKQRPPAPIHVCGRSARAKIRPLRRGQPREVGHMRALEQRLRAPGVASPTKRPPRSSFALRFKVDTKVSHAGTDVGSIHHRGHVVAKRGLVGSRQCQRQMVARCSARRAEVHMSVMRAALVAGSGPSEESSFLQQAKARWSRRTQ
jgi:hypothetical protein